MNDIIATLTAQLPAWAEAFGFQQVGISDLDLDAHDAHLRRWLAAGRHGEMAYMARHDGMRGHPEQLHPGTLSVISVRMDYLPAEPAIDETLANGERAYVARYALGRDYHKVLRKRLGLLAGRINDFLVDHGHPGHNARPVTDSAPLLERAVAEKAGLGWIGKNTMLINRHAGSWFFLGEILTDLPLPATDDTMRNHCGSCRACIDVCPTDAIVAPYELDARRCISYLTIELRGSIPLELRRPIGNRIFGCDDCQQVCPWNRYAQPTAEADFRPRQDLDTAMLLALFAWDEATFLSRTEGSAIRRTGFDGWQRNLAVALGNAPFSEEILATLRQRLATTNSELVAEHINWAISEQEARQETRKKLSR